MSENIEGSTVPEVAPVTEATEAPQFNDHVAKAQWEKKQKEQTVQPKAEETENNEPWKPKQKEGTPKWARERFRELSSKNREKDSQIEQLTNSVKEILNAFRPKDKELKPEDFPNQVEYAKHIAKITAQEAVKGETEAFRAEQEATKEREQLDASHARNLANASTDLPDYHEVVASGDPDITLPVSVIKHLKVSPAGPYVEYRIASDDELSAALKEASTPQEKWQIVARVHDEILESLSKRSSAQPVTQAQAPVAPVAQKPAPAQSPAVRKAIPPPAAPPKSRGMVTSTNLLEKSGDDYIKARNEQRRESSRTKL